jgi:nucleoid DNA-binding protein
MAKSKPAAGGKGDVVTKTGFYDALAASAGISRKQVAAVFAGISEVVRKHLKKDGDVIKIPGMFRVKLVKKKAVKGGKTVNNPFKPGETMITKDKPARNVLKIVALKGMKDLVQ